MSESKGKALRLKDGKRAPRLIGWYQTDTGIISTVNGSPSDPFVFDKKGGRSISKAHINRVRASVSPDYTYVMNQPAPEENPLGASIVVS